MATRNKFKKMLAMVLAFALVFGTVPITAAASPMEVTFVSGQQSGIPVGDYFVDFAAGNFPFMYEATEGDSLVFSQYVTVTANNGFNLDETLIPPDLLPPVELPPVEVPESNEYDEDESGEYSDDDYEYESDEYGEDDYEYESDEYSEDELNEYENGYGYSGYENGYTNGEPQNGYGDGYENGGGVPEYTPSENGNGDAVDGSDNEPPVTDPPAEDPTPENGDGYANGNDETLPSGNGNDEPTTDYDSGNDNGETPPTDNGYDNSDSNDNGGYVPSGEAYDNAPYVQAPDYAGVYSNGDDSYVDTYANDNGITNSVTLVWYLDGTPRMDKGTILIREDMGNMNMPVRVALAFDEVSLADMGVWTLRAYSFGEWVESEYALFLVVGEFEPPVGIVPLNEVVWDGASPNSTVQGWGAAGGTVIIGPNATGSVSVPAGATVIFQALDGNVTIPPTGWITISGGGGTAVFDGHFNADISLQVGNAVILSDSFLNFQTNFTLNFPASLTITNHGIFQTSGTGTINLNGILHNHGTFINNIPTFRVRNAGDVGAITNHPGGTITNNSTITNNGEIINNGLISSAPDSITGTGTITGTQPIPPGATFAVTMQNAGTGASRTPAGNIAPGNPVVLNAGTRAGYVFENWTSDDVVISSANVVDGATFTMPGNAVTVTANWLLPPAVTVNQNGGTGSTASPDPVAPGGTVTLTAGTPPAGYVFSHWTILPVVTITNYTQPTGASFVMPNEAVTVTVNWHSNALPALSWDMVQLMLNDTAVTTVNLAGLPNPNPARTLTTPNGRTVTIVGGGSQINDVAFSFGNNNNITIDNLNIHSESGQGSALAFAGANNTLHIRGTNSVTATSGTGVQVNSTAELTITGEGTGQLTAQGGGTGAGIGGGSNSANGRITINSGRIYATGGGLMQTGAGIGGSGGGAVGHSNPGDITINGGHIIATGGTDGNGAAGIGAGNGGGAGTAPAGNITITGGTVIATGSGTNRFGAGIGGGGSTSDGIGGNGGTVIISGDANVTAISGGGDAMAIGFGAGGTGGNGTPGTLNIPTGSGTPTITANAAIPPITGDPLITIGTQPQNATVSVGNIGNTDTLFIDGITRRVSNDFTIQWFSNTTNNIADGTATVIAGATDEEFTIPTNLTEGTHYFFAEVRLTGLPDSVAVRSTVAVVTVLAGSPQTVTFLTVPSPSDTVTAVFGDSPITHTATTTGTGAITYSIVTVPATGVASINASTGQITIQGVGTATITATAAAVPGQWLEASATFSLTVTQATPIANAPTGLTATFGETLANVTLTNPASNTPGTWAWVNGATSVGDVLATPATFPATFTPTDTTNFTTVNNVQVAVTVNQAPAPNIIWPTAGVINYGQMLSNSTLTGGTVGYGTFVWANPSHTPNAGADQPFSMIFTPSAATVQNFLPITTTAQDVNISVNRIANPAPPTTSTNVISGQINTDVTLTLPTLPLGATYPASGTVGGTAALITSHSVSGNTLTFNTSNQPDNTTATIVFAIDNATNYEPFNVVVTITAVDREIIADTFIDITGLTLAHTFNGTAQGIGTPTAASGFPGTGTVNFTINYGATGATPPHIAGTYTVTITAQNDTHIATREVTLVINRLQLNWVANSGIANGRVFDNTTDATIQTQPTLSGIVTGFDAPITPGTITFASGNAGTQAITATGFSVDVGMNYLAPTTQPTFANAVITALPVTITPDTGQTKVFNTADPTFTFTPSPALLGADTFTGSLGRVAGEDVGTHNFTIGNLTAGGNYTLSLGGAVTFEITQAPLPATTYNVYITRAIASSGNTLNLLDVLPANRGSATPAFGTPSVAGANNAYVTGAAVSGNNLTFNTTANAPLNTATITVPVSGMTNFQNGNITLTVNFINEQVPTVNWPTDLTAAVGQTLANVTLPANTGGTAGMFSWVEVTTTPVGGVGNQIHELRFTPTDTATYAIITQNVIIYVSAALSNNANLQSLTVMPANITGTIAGQNVTATVVTGVAGQTIDVVTEHANATWTITGSGVSSPDPGVYTVTLNPGNNTVTLTITAEDGTTREYTVNIERIVPVTGVSITQNDFTLQTGQTQALTATVAPANATNQSVTWTSSNTAVATVNATGLVTAVAPGTVTITVTTVDGNFTDTVQVTVTDTQVTTYAITVAPAVASYVSVSPATAAVGDTITVTITPPSGQRLVNNGITATGVTTFTGNTTGSISVTFVKTAGATTVNATFETITAPIAVTGVSITQNNFTLQAGQTQALTATIAPANATNPSVTWASGNTAIATVNAAGLVTAVAPGTATITVTTVDGNFTDTVQVTVTAAQVQNFTITFNPNSGSVNPTYGITDANGRLATLPTPSRSGNWSFVGWFTAQTGGTQVTTNTVFTANATIFARWSQNQDDQGGNNNQSGNNNNQGGNNQGQPTPTPSPTPASTPSPTPQQNVAPTTPATIPGYGGADVVNIPVTVDVETGTVTILLNEVATQKLIDDALTTAEEYGTIPTVTIDLSGVTDATVAVFTVSTAKALADEGAVLTLVFPNGQMTLSSQNLAVLANMDVHGETLITVELQVTPGNETALAAGIFFVVEVDITVGDEATGAIAAPFTITVCLADFDLTGLNTYRIIAMYGNPTIVGGNYDAETGLFTFEAPTTGTFTIAYVETLIRLAMQMGSSTIFDLAGNAPTQVMDVLPIIQNGRTLVPIRFVGEALGAEVDWTPATDYSPMIAILTLDGRTLMLPIGQITPELAALGMDVPAQVMDGRTMVPLRFVSEFFGALVMWDGEVGGIEIFRNPVPFNTTPLTETHVGIVMALREDEDETEIPANDDDNDNNEPDPDTERILSLEELDAFEVN